MGVTLSPDGNCIGSYNPIGAGAPTAGSNPPTCNDNNDSECVRWKTAGSLGGFITLKEAEGVNVKTLGKTLCVLLTKGLSTTPDGKNCATNPDGSIVAKGDFCSTTDSPGGCQDSYWLAATFAASAAKISSGASVPQCNGSLLDGGVVVPEAGTDAGGGGDAGDGGAPSDAGPSDAGNG
jgi:hypothetical protein